MSLISTDRLEASLREIMNHLSAQAAEINNIKSSIQSCGTKDDLRNLEQAISLRISGLERRVDNLELDTSIDLPLSVLEDALDDQHADNADGSLNPDRPIARVPISRFVVSHHGHLRDLHRSMALAATKTELAAVRSESSAVLQSAMNTVADERASKNALNEIQNSAEALQSQVTALQGVLATKVDRAEVIGIKSVAAELQLYQGFKAAATNDIRELSTRTDEHRAALNKSLESVTKLSATVQALASSVSGKAERAALETAASQIERLAVNVESRAMINEVRNVSATVVAVTERVSGLEFNAKELSRIAIEDKKALEHKIGASAAVLRGEFDGKLAGIREDINDLQQELETRAYIASVEATDENVARLVSASDLLGRKVEVALRFIDWYADRGEAYEYNAAALERHMNALAVGNRARVVDTVADMKSKVLGASLDAPAGTDGGAAYQRVDAAALGLAASTAAAQPPGGGGPSGHPAASGGSLPSTTPFNTTSAISGSGSAFVSMTPNAGGVGSSSSTAASGPFASASSTTTTGGDQYGISGGDRLSRQQGPITGSAGVRIGGTTSSSTMATAPIPTLA